MGAASQSRALEAQNAQTAQAGQAGSSQGRVRRGAEQLGQVLVLGLGTSGTAVVNYCLPLLGSRVSGIFVAAGADTADARAFARSVEAEGVQVAFGDDAVDVLAGRCAGGRFDLCVPSPGIPPASTLYQRGAALSDQVAGEVELAWRESDPDAKWIAVTGTNGKTTTTSLAAHILRQAGQEAVAVGNIGDTCIEAVAKGAARVFVAEVSSYQLYSTSAFAPDVAVLLNITPDHLKWHGSFEEHRPAKLKAFRNLGASGASDGALAVLDATDDEVRAFVRSLRSESDEARGFSYVPVGSKAGYEGDMRRACGSENAAFVAPDGVLTVALGGVEHRLARASELQIKGAHNVGNALAASAAALACGAGDDAVARALASFAPLEHRIEPCGSIAGAACYNDSKATNVDATLVALAAFPEARPIVLLGGDDKGTDLAPLVDAVHRHARAAVCFGDAAARFEAAFEGAADAAPPGFKLLHAGRLADALDVACSIAQAGDVILLSPACASFDEFSCFEERGEVFKRLVAERAAFAGVDADGRSGDAAPRP